MSDNLFLDESPAPDRASIAAALGGRLPLYERILAAADGFERDWKHYGRKYGWKLKVHDGEKALLELTLRAEGMGLILAARESEVAALRADPATAALLGELLPPGASKEGWGLRLSVADEEGCARAVALIGAVAALR